jgi:hypothetical protein
MGCIPRECDDSQRRSRQGCPGTAALLCTRQLTTPKPDLDIDTDVPWLYNRPNNWTDVVLRICGHILGITRRFSDEEARHALSRR